MKLWEKQFARSLTSIRREEDADPAASSSDVAGQGSAAPSSSPAPAQPQFQNSPLPAAMLAVAHDDSPENRQVLYDSMLKTWFLVPTRGAIPDSPGFHDVKEGTAASFSLEHDSVGQLVAVAFTDEEALRNWNKTIPYIALQGTAFFQAVLSTEAEEIVINPFEPEDPASKMIRPGGRVTRWEFAALAAGNAPQSAADADEPESQSVLVSMPKHMPTAEMLDKLCDAAKNSSEVSGMYFAQVSYPDGEPHWTVAVDFVPAATDQQMRQAIAALAKEARLVFPRTLTIDLLPATSTLGQSIATTGKRFYPRD